MKSVLYTTGFAQDGKPLVGGIFTMKDELGFPVDMSCEICKENGIYIDWCEFLADAGRQKQWKFDDALNEIKWLIPNEYDEIYNKFKLWGAYLMKEYNYTDFIECCEKMMKDKECFGLYEKKK